MQQLVVALQLDAARARRCPQRVQQARCRHDAAKEMEAVRAASNDSLLTSVTNSFRFDARMASIPSPGRSGDSSGVKLYPSSIQPLQAESFN